VSMSLLVKRLVADSRFNDRQAPQSNETARVTAELGTMTASRAAA
jgi:hypothetical protein